MRSPACWVNIHLYHVNLLWQLVKWILELLLFLFSTSNEVIPVLGGEIHYMHAMGWRCRWIFDVGPSHLQEAISKSESTQSSLCWHFQLVLSLHISIDTSQNSQFLQDVTLPTMTFSCGMQENRVHMDKMCDKANICKVQLLSMALFLQIMIIQHVPTKAEHIAVHLRSFHCRCEPGYTQGYGNTNEWIGNVPNTA